MTRFECFKSMDIDDLTKYIYKNIVDRCAWCAYDHAEMCYKSYQYDGYRIIEQRPFKEVMCWDGIKKYLESETESD